ncbi:hypothetical protein EFS28_07490 [Lactobacillus acidophilus]|uniref:hypothetical protein n=1 Tax=Lactobacillus acidophilus TaxID=1579 RepID=UPI0021A6A4FA|nr:hypothetical protein [Lactobacillus acidophilus]MCT3602313.1 hypothetical protein [Lactobacillus acidophilus]MCT3624050.1 hypothetical protein [Lactobacillus acidophilus]
MTTNELESKLNELNDKMKFSVREYDKDQAKISDDSSVESGLILLQVHKGEIWIYAKMESPKVLIAKIMPPHDSLAVWSVDLESHISCYDREGLGVYMRILAVIDQFLADKKVK